MSASKPPPDLHELLHPFWTKLTAGQLPEPLTTTARDRPDRAVLLDLFESQLQSRLMDLESRRRAPDRQTFYSIGSAGHEGNAAIARAARHTDMAFLHYRSGAFFIERARQLNGQTPLFDLALSFAASAKDPISGGRHKVIGSRALHIPPQTSTIASHLPKAVGAAFALGLARGTPVTTTTPPDGVILCSFGDASANHSTARGAFNTAGWTAHQGTPLPLLFICEDNGIGISVRSPKGWMEASLRSLQGLEYFSCDGRDIADALHGAERALRYVRKRRCPAILHMRTVRLHGHAGSDVETAYRDRREVAAEAEHDPLLHSARHLIESEAASAEQITALITREAARVRHLFDHACRQPRLSAGSEVMASITPPPAKAEAPAQLPEASTTPVTMSRAIADTLDEQMQLHPEIIVFGEDVGVKGGVYGATKHLAQRHGRKRVFDTLLDEQAILGSAIGLAQQGFLPIPEIQFLAYVHNAADQIRGEAATLSFFSDGQYDNPMVIRIAGLGYQRGFGGHFHNDNALAAFRDIPGVVMLAPSSPAQAARTLREAIRLARVERRVVIHLEPIALYNMKDLHVDGDGAFLQPRSASSAHYRNALSVVDHGDDLALISFANGCYMARRVAQRLLHSHGIRSSVIDIQTLVPLPIDDLVEKLKPFSHALIVDECRQSGSLSEALLTQLREAGVQIPLSRVNSRDSFIPLGPAANEVLLSEAEIEQAALTICAQGEPA
jgi:2-oxoisovalerate dehydrogenase E1 component